jgi:Tol biopolymer transport system component
LADRDPNWSPSGRRIAIGSAFGSETREFEIDIFMMRENATHRRRITNPGPGFEDYDPSWSPDGTLLTCSGKV